MRILSAKSLAKGKGKGAKGKGKGKKGPASRPVKKSDVALTTNASSKTSELAQLDPITRPLKAPEKKERVFRLNKVISVCAQRKSTSKGLKAIDLFRTEGLPLSGHTVSSMLNFYVRLHMLTEAEQLFFEHFGGTPAAAERSSSSLLTVAFTTLLKGVWTEAGNHSATDKLLEFVDSQSANIWNDRARATFFRGCLRWGAVRSALERASTFSSTGNLLLEPSSFEYLTKLCCNAAKMKTVKDLLAKQEKKNLLGSDVQICGPADVQCVVAVARARLLLGQVADAKKLLQKAQKMFMVCKSDGNFGGQGGTGDGAAPVGAEEEGEDGAADSEEEEEEAEQEQIVSAGGGPAPDSCRGVSRKEKEKGKNKSSAATFQKHALADLRFQTNYLLKKCKNAEKDLCNLSTRPTDLDFAQFLYKGEDSEEDPRNLKSIGHRGELSEALKPVDRSFLEGLVLGGGKSKSTSREVVLELGAGNGEWAIATAKAAKKRADTSDDEDDPMDGGNSSNSPLFVASELRHDRCATIFAKKVLENLDNLVVLGGDATSLVPLTVPDGLLSKVVSNFPEPPAWHQDTDFAVLNKDLKPAPEESGQPEQQHLLTSTFLNDIVWTKLKTGGEFLVFTDNRKYGEWLLATLDAEKWRAPDGADKISLTPGRPAEAEGIQTYFDKLWSRGKKKDRVFLRAVKR